MTKVDQENLVMPRPAISTTLANMPINRRRMLQHCTNGFGMLALADLLAAQARGDLAAASLPAAHNPLAVRAPHHAARAKRVIFLFMPGGPSHVDLFDPKPRLEQDNGKPLPF